MPLGRSHREQGDGYGLREVLVGPSPTKEHEVSSVEELDAGTRSSKTDGDGHRHLNHGEQADEDGCDPERRQIDYEVA